MTNLEMELMDALDAVLTWLDGHLEGEIYEQAVEALAKAKAQEREEI